MSHDIKCDFCGAMVSEEETLQGDGHVCDKKPVVRTAVRPVSMPLFAAANDKAGEVVSGCISWIAPGSQAVNNWRAGRLVDADGETVKFVGSCMVKTGDSVRLHGLWEDDAKWGRQFRVSYATAAIGRNYESIRKLFEADADFKQIGPKRAQYIVDFLRRNNLDLEDVLESEDLLERLASEAKLPPQAIEHLVKSWSEKREENIAKAEMISLGVPSTKLEPVWKAFGRFAVDTIRDNPYVLTETIDGFGLAEADKIAKALKLSDSDPRRIVCGVMNTMRREVVGNGHTWITRRKLSAETVRVLQIGRAGDHKKAADTLEDLLSKGRLKTTGLPGIDGEIVCDPELHGHEQKFTATFSAAAKDRANPYFSTTPPPIPVTHKPRVIDHEDGYDGYVPAPSAFGVVVEAPKKQFGPLDPNWVERVAGSMSRPEKKFSPSQKQIDAVEAFAKWQFIALTGAAGTGKTACTTMMLKVCEERNLHVALAAPTGKAAMRLNEMILKAQIASKPTAATIHKLLGYQGERWTYNERCKLPVDVLFIDECSMIDIVLMSRLIDALPHTAAVVFIGDHNQLPPVGAGAVFRDMIESELCHVVKLETVFRQAGALRRNAADVLRGVMTPTTTDDGVETWRVEDDHKDPQAAHNAIVAHYRARLTELGERGLLELQVLSPMYDGVVGITELNKSLRPIAHEVLYGETIDPERTTCVGDKVIQTKNDYQVGIMNGDQGVVRSTNGFWNATMGRNEAGWVVEIMRGDQRDEIGVPINRTSGFMLAYAISVHRFQGSEAEHVIGAMHSTHKHMLNRPLIYTTSTRASKTLTLVGDRDGLYDGAKRDNTAHRRTLTAPKWLVDRLAKDPAA